MEAIITSLGGSVDFVVTTTGKVITMVVAQPLLLIGLSIGLLGSAVGLFKSLKRG